MMTLAEAAERFPPIWTIHDSPADFPNRIVVRVAYGECVCPDVFLVRSIEDAREHVIADGACVCLGRQPDDPPHIVESWI